VPAEIIFHAHTIHLWFALDVLFGPETRCAPRVKMLYFSFVTLEQRPRDPHSIRKLSPTCIQVEQIGCRHLPGSPVKPIEHEESS